jgi:ectoine hydroxylase-related dioxygenase (phytanoyl-CoA dioxygenase family)
MKDNDLDKNGFIAIKIPKNLIKDLNKAIIENIKINLSCKKKEIDNFLKIQKKVTTISNKLFSTKFGHNSYRQLNKVITSKINNWVKKSIPKKIKSNKACINYVSKSELKINKRLQNKQISIYYRLVRGNKKRDVGYPHRDIDFWNLGYRRKASIEPKSRWKIWIPIWGCDKNNTLNFIPGSNQKKILINYLKKNGGVKPIVSKSYFKNNKNLSKSGLSYKDNLNAILFHEKTVHYAPQNTSTKLRISAEFTIYAR